MDIPTPPKGLKAHGKTFWNKTLCAFVLEDEHDLERLKQACSCLDQLAECEKVLSKEGMFIEDRFRQRREHPALKASRDLKVVFCRIVRELALDIEPAATRPPRLR